MERPAPYRLAPNVLALHPPVRSRLVDDPPPPYLPTPVQVVCVRLVVSAERDLGASSAGMSPHK